MSAAPSVPGRPSHYPKGVDRRIEKHPVHGLVERVWGHDHVCMIAVPSGEVSGSIYTIQQVGAGQLGGSSAAAASTHKRWVPNHIEYQFITSLGNSSTGTYVAVIDPDPVAPWESGSATNLARISASTGSVFKQFGQHDTVTLPPSRDYTSLWCEDRSPVERTEGDRLTYAGQYLMVCAVPTGLPAGTTIGMVRRWYDISYLIDTVTVTASTNTTEIKYTGAAAQAFRAATAAGAAAVDTLIDIAKNVSVAMPDLSFGGANTLLRTYKSVSIPSTSYNEDKEPVTAYSYDDTAGFLSGNISTFVFINSSGTGAQVNPLATRTAYYSSGVAFSGGTANRTTPASSDLYSYDGVTYTTGSTLECEFGVGRKAAWRDHVISWTGDQSAANLTVILMIRHAANDEYTQMTSAYTSTPAKKKMEHPSAATCVADLVPPLERKTPAGWELDIEDLPPPRGSRTPSAVPGGSLYAPSARHIMVEHDHGDATPSRKVPSRK